jgi:hypothetical protein
LLFYSFLQRNEIFLELKRGAVDLWKAPQVVLGAGLVPRGRLLMKGSGTSAGGGKLFSREHARASGDRPLCKSR